MLTTLTVLSLDQGNIYGIKPRRPTEGPDAATIEPVSANACECGKQGGRSASPARALGSLLRRLAFALTTTRRRA